MTERKRFIAKQAIGGLLVSLTAVAILAILFGSVAIDFWSAVALVSWLAVVKAPFPIAGLSFSGNEASYAVGRVGDAGTLSALRRARDFTQWTASRIRRQPFWPSLSP